MIHRLPWEAPKNAQADDGPRADIEFELAGVLLQVRTTDTTGHIGRARYRVACVDCDCLLHDCTPIPKFYISGHLSERHGFKGAIEYTEARKHRRLVDRKTSEML